MLVVSPYNAQVAEIKKHVPDGVKVGTVDKFQGQEAPITIYSMASSTAEDAPRGMDFLYDLHRLNVAVSRAQVDLDRRVQPRAAARAVPHTGSAEAGERAVSDCTRRGIGLTGAESIVHLYSGSTIDFVEDATHNRIADKVAESFERYFRYEPTPSELQSWRSSLHAMSDVVRHGDLLDNGIVVELQLPLSSKRLDCMVTGHDQAGRPEAVIVELKQWQHAGPSWVDDCVSTFVGGRERDVLHPSRQVGNYERYLLDVHSTFNEGAVGLRSCSYLHNMRSPDATALVADEHRELIQLYPMFVGDQVDDLVDYLAANVGEGGGGPVLDDVLRGKYRPHKRLLDHVAKMVADEPTFVLLDDQQVACNAVLTKVRARHLAVGSAVLLIRGGPGTGKSVLAVNLVGELARQGLVVHHATGSRSFTESLRKRVGPRAGALFKYFNGFRAAGDEPFDVLICDEAHRIRETSQDRFTKKEDRSDRPQIDELVAAAKVSVFFIDDLQVVRPGEIGSAELIRESAAAPRRRPRRVRPRDPVPLRRLRRVCELGGEHARAAPLTRRDVEHVRGVRLRGGRLAPGARGHHPGQGR